MHECNPIDGSPKTHWAESGGKGWTALDDERDQRQVEGMREGPSKRRHLSPKHIRIRMKRYLG